MLATQKKAATQSKRHKPPAPPEPLQPTGVTLTPTEVATLDRLAKEQSDFIGRTISRSTVLRALVRLAEVKIRPLELRNAIEEELQQGRKWGQDSTKPPA